MYVFIYVCMHVCMYVFVCHGNIGLTGTEQGGNQKYFVLHCITIRGLMLFKL